MENTRVAILFGKLSDDPTEDEKDVLDEIENVTKHLIMLGYEPFNVPFSLDIPGVIKQLKAIDPLFVFNLVESVEGKGELQIMSPIILHHLNLRYTGVPLEALHITTNKVMTKQYLRLMGVNTPDWWYLHETDKLDPSRKYILKPRCEDASLGLNDLNVFQGSDTTFIKKLKDLNPRDYFIEAYLEGREINQAILGGKEGPILFPTSEILFENYPEGKPKIIGYESKWFMDSFEYLNTPRTFEFARKDKAMVEQVRNDSMRVWNEFGMKGYARLDWRTDENNIPYVLEVNGNPCITEESGFWSTAEEAGMSFLEVVRKIVEDVLV